MEDKTQEIIQKLNALVASQSVLQLLALALFDAIEDKTHVIQQFTETANETHRLSLSSRPKEFLAAFEEYQRTILKLLVEPKSLLGPRNGIC
jgi:predicted RNA-binding Zn ribbon-like protein